MPQVLDGRTRRNDDLDGTFGLQLFDGGRNGFVYPQLAFPVADELFVAGRTSMGPGLLLGDTGAGIGAVLPHDLDQPSEPGPVGLIRSQLARSLLHHDDIPRFVGHAIDQRGVLRDGSPLIVGRFIVDVCGVFLLVFPTVAFGRAASDKESFQHDISDACGPFAVGQGGVEPGLYRAENHHSLPD